ncbi:histidine kinase [Gleimia coleocanis DSM 15436]|uniref:Histidine kinase n=1 Tax=Gleimia coleocanis DSM 15436 TaxID=525245 RepID=C0W090_9ACTO|nr:histidine kinase [Gleimia coleocanis]EEH63949.1 histidine kinase [Gleimia coleocanis DSM 15436]
MRNWKLQADPSETKSVLAHSAPFLVFLGFPLVAASQQGTGSLTWYLVVVSTLIYAVIYLLTAVALPIAPRSSKVTKRFITWQVSFAVFTVLYMLLIHLVGGIGIVFFLSYFLSLWILQALKPLLLPGALLTVALATVTAFLIPGEIKFSPLILLLAGFTVFMSRRAIDLDNQGRENAAKELLYAQEKERNRISADLHDVLGQTLTALSLKAELAEKLLEAEQTEKVAGQLKQLQDLTRKALNEVRAVVAANRALDLEAEIQNCMGICETAGIKLLLRAEYATQSAQLQTISAYVLREAITNALRHASPTEIAVTIDATHIQVTNDINSVKNSAGTGLGIDSLKQRVGNLGKVSAEQTQNQWILEVSFHQA